eukprot:403354695
MVNRINRETKLWHPLSPEKNPMKNFTTEQLKKILGVKTPAGYFDANYGQQSPSKTTSAYTFSAPKSPVSARGTSGTDYLNRQVAKQMPSSYDVRTVYPMCENRIKDQAQCGSCWAFATTNVLEYRYCMATKGKKYPELSPQNLISCFNSASWGCDGGYIDQTFLYLEMMGVNTEQCMPYKSGDGNMTACPSKCANGENLYMNKYYCRPGSTQYMRGEQQFKNYLFNKGPMVAVFDVFEDFINYGGGIYNKVSGDKLGKHAVKLLGYGVENSTNYYIGVNQWGKDWGEDGYFRIKAGEVLIDNEGYGCDPYA